MAEIARLEPITVARAAWALASNADFAASNTQAHADAAANRSTALKRAIAVAAAAAAASYGRLGRADSFAGDGTASELSDFAGKKRKRASSTGTVAFADTVLPPAAAVAEPAAYGGRAVITPLPTPGATSPRSAAAAAASVLPPSYVVPLDGLGRSLAARGMSTLFDGYYKHAGSESESDDPGTATI
jgi:hypothetical protein